MKKQFFLQPRQVGKTTMAIYQFLFDIDNTLFVTHNKEMARRITKRIFNQYSRSNIVSCEEVIHKRLGSEYKNIILDEYMFFKNKRNLYVYLNGISNIENLYIFSTSDMQYDRSIYESVIMGKRIELDHSAILRDYRLVFGNLVPPNANKQIESLFYNFLTDPDTNVVDYGFEFPKHRIDEMRNALNDEQFDVEIMNRYLVSG